MPDPFKSTPEQSLAKNKRIIMGLWIIVGVLLVVAFGIIFWLQQKYPGLSS